MSRRTLKLGAVLIGVGGPGPATTPGSTPRSPATPASTSAGTSQQRTTGRGREVRPRVHRRQPVHHRRLAAPLPQPARAADPAVGARRVTPSTSVSSARSRPPTTQPFNVARRLASLDLISGGRAGWNVVTSGDAGTAGNYSLDEHYDYATRYGRGLEHVQVGARRCGTPTRTTRSRATGRPRRVPRPHPSSTRSTTGASTSRSSARSTSSARARASR